MDAASDKTPRAKRAGSTGANGTTVVAARLPVNEPKAGTTARPRATVPCHVAIVMDGNGRWARRRAQPRSFGHRAGQKAVRTTVAYCLRNGVGVLTLFAFSSENWKRPRTEVGALMDLFL
ncbi:MAG: hypothetical protein EPN40_08380, partial [Rhodanobacteraceae bacterium]